MHGTAGRRTVLRDDLPAAMDTRRAEAETIAEAYSRAHRGDDRTALVAAIVDALADLAAAEEWVEATRRQVSRGYVRAGAPAADERA